MGTYVSDLVGDVDGALGRGDGVHTEGWSHGVAEHHGGHVEGMRRWAEEGCEGLENGWNGLYDDDDDDTARDRSD